MHVLVTGHLGYVGPYVVATLKDAGHRVTGLDVGYFRECIDDLPKFASADHELIVDIRDASSGELNGIDAIVHLAGLSNDPLGQLNPALTAAINHDATMQLAASARKAGVDRFVFASSCSIYGAAGNAAVLNEEAVQKPESAYAASKVACERELAAQADKSFAPVLLRFATAFGLSPRMRFDLVLANLTGWARTTGTVKVLSDGTPWRPLVHIADMALAIRCAVEAPREKVAGRAFNIGRPDNNVQVRDIADIVRRQVTNSRVEIIGETGGDPRSYRVDFSRALTQLPGFAPSWTVDKGCEEIDRWIVDRKVDVESFQSRRYIRLKQLQYLRETNTINGDLRFAKPAADETLSAVVR
jgi:nucleoside-diphosphate-sugar epimerase